MNNKEYFDRIAVDVKKYKSDNSIQEDDKYAFMLLSVQYFESSNSDDIEIFDEYLTKFNSGIDGLYKDIDNKILTLIIVDYSIRFTENTFNEKIRKLLEKAKNLLELKFQDYENKLDKNSLTFDIVYDIDKRLKDWTINVELYSNLDYSAKELITELILSDEFKISVKYFFLDDYRHYINLKNDTLKIDLAQESKGSETGVGIEVIKISQSKSFTTYIGSVKGDFLANIYSKYGPRLLNYNVRAYLKKSQRVNKGIIETIQDSSEYFVAFNNGLSTVATNVTFSPDKSGRKIIKTLENWQIVNGGQTTASIYESINIPGLKNVIVPFKLTVLSSQLENSIEIIQSIAEYSNTQTVIRASDNVSNDPVYKDFEKLSRETFFIDNDKKNVKWFFERLNGQYHTEMVRSGNIKNFESVYISKLKFNKSTLAKAIMSWEQRPSMVSQGNERNFSEFNDDFRGMIDKINIEYYRKVVGLLVLYTETDKIIKNLKIPFKQNVLTYTISKLSSLYNKKIDFMDISTRQSIPDYLIEDVVKIARIVGSDLNNPPSEHPNVSMWSRKENCWDRVKKIKINVNSSKYKVETSFIIVNPKIAIFKANYKNERFWSSLLTWNTTNRVLFGKSLSMIISMKKLAASSKEPTIRQKSYGLSVYLNAAAKGFDYDN